MSLNNIKLISGNSNLELGIKISENFGIPLCKSVIDNFNNTETHIEILENIRGTDVFIIQTGSSYNKRSVNDHFIETIMLIDVCRRSNAKSITLIMPYFPYSRQDKKDRPRVPISSKVIANIIEQSGVDRVITTDLHSGQIQGFFNIPVDNLYCVNIIADYLLKTVLSKKTNNFVLISPDNGGVKRIFAYARILKLQCVIMHKQRDHSKVSHIESSILIGENDCVKDKTCIIIDDMVDTMGTIINASEILMKNGASDIIVCATHGILSNPALNRLISCDYISRLIITNSLPQKENMTICSKIEIVDISSLLCSVINNIMTGGSISKLFEYKE